MPEDKIETLFLNIKPEKQVADISSNTDLDAVSKMKAQRHMILIQSLNNIFELITHRTFLALITVILLIFYLATRYILVIHPELGIIRKMNEDVVIAIKYFATAVITLLFTTAFDKNNNS